MRCSTIISLSSGGAPAGGFLGRGAVGLIVSNRPLTGAPRPLDWTIDLMSKNWVATLYMTSGAFQYPSCY